MRVFTHLVDGNFSSHGTFGCAWFAPRKAMQDLVCCEIERWFPKWQNQYRRCNCPVRFRSCPAACYQCGEFLRHFGVQGSGVAGWPKIESPCVTSVDTTQRACCADKRFVVLLHLFRGIAANIHHKKNPSNPNNPRTVHTMAAQQLHRRLNAIRGIAASIHHIQRIVHNLAAQHLHKLL